MDNNYVIESEKELAINMSHYKKDQNSYVANINATIPNSNSNITDIDPEVIK